MSRMLVGIGLGLGGCLLAAGAAVAQVPPSYRASDVERYFSAREGASAQGGAPARDLGPSRGLCIGAESQCSSAVPARPKVSGGFDLLVNFGHNSDVLTPGAKANLDEFTKALRSDRLRSAAFTVEGHTDAKGGDGFNLDLSARRARSVVRYLSGHGVPADRLEARAFGKSRPRTADPADPVNRRVEAHLRGE
ncbi:Peptidoglycan-associated lipoprotein [Methylobacterium crusticola]|uniref:Peptidoglycan-associated lipoprotein n=1 Tax=Methylobacterium crusticola TaxID=1697972 RepID=A0ABQ4QRA6_9HYPH|nr:OmpA family protein [Methylobacterium crusticola]GJD47759.1 Peptidoglycan-associated lipoprotein [Methylobacterium crusticola]